MVKHELEKIIQKAAENFGTQLPKFSVEIPGTRKFGDYSTNIALGLAKKISKNPMDVAEDIVSYISPHKFIEKIEVAPPGFINFYLSKDFFAEQVGEVLKNKKFGEGEHVKGYNIMIEYTDPNPFKDFHIGHLMSNTIGESLSRIFEFNGAKIKRANYQGDVGLHVAKALWAKRKNPGSSWQMCYSLGSAEYDSNDSVKEEIIELNKKIYEGSDKKINALYAEGKDASLKYFKEIYKKLDTQFDYYFFESQVADFGKQIVENNMGKVFEQGDKGAIIFKGENVGLHTRVFINSEGLPTYEAKELGLADIKYKKYKYDWSVIVTGNEVNDYFKVLLAAMEQIFPKLAQKTKHIGHGMLRLPEGKMSSRTGNVITAEFLIDEIKKKIQEKVGGRNLHDSDIEKIAIGAIKYSILKQSIGSDIIYDVEKSISFEGDSGPYLQYSLVRALSVLQKAKQERVKPLFKKVPLEIGQLEKMMIHFPEVVEKAGKEYQPHYIATYITELAHEFNNYYTHNKIVDKSDEFSRHKVALTQAFSIIMNNGLWLLGISAPQKM